MYTCLLDISYYGKNFAGFAKQPNISTIQGNLENALHTIFSKDISTVCSGRTDSGVHAKHQYVSFVLNDEEISRFNNNVNKLEKSLNSLTHEDIYINSVKLLNYEFSARFDAKSRKYSYFIVNQKKPPLFMRDFSWHIYKPLDIKKMEEASKFLIGEHDFKSFCVSASLKNRSTFRNIKEIKFENYYVFDENIIEIKITGNAFLHSMVRTIVGSLVRVGTGLRPQVWIKNVLEAKNRQAAGDCAPAKALVFMEVQF